MMKNNDVMGQNEKTMKRELPNDQPEVLGITELVADTVTVALIFFRRDCVLQVIDQIRNYAPKRLYLIADGGRTPEEHSQCIQLRARVEAAIDWDCDVSTKYSDVNLGCRQNIPDGLDWVFSEVERAIVFEDDCVPCMDFFKFCEEMLDHYADNRRISLISGFNHLDKRPYYGSDSYIFSDYTILSGGWATWSRVWKCFDGELKLWPKARRTGFLKSMSFTREHEVYWDQIFESIWNRTCDFDPWDYQFTFSIWMNRGLSVVPKANLVTNIGFGPLATHTNDEANPLANRPTGRLAFPLIHPTEISRHIDYDDALGKIVYYGSSHSKKWLLFLRLISYMPFCIRPIIWLSIKHYQKLKNNSLKR